MRPTDTMRGQNWERWLYSRLFEQVPCNIAIIDRNFNIMENNRNFIELFGEGRNKKCYQIYKRQSSPCVDCAAFKTFSDGKTRVNEEVGVDRYGRTAYYIVHIAPIFDENGDIPFIIEMSTDISESKRLQREYQVLFERVPCYVTVLNKDLRIVRANERFRTTFGEPKGKKCYEVYKKTTHECPDCPALHTFKDGSVHTVQQRGINKVGDPTYYMVTTSPLIKDEVPVTNVIEISLDVTDIHKLEAELRREHAFRERVIENSTLALVTFGPEGLIHSLNPAAEKLLGYDAQSLIGKHLPISLFPPAYLSDFFKGKFHSSREITLIARNDVRIPVLATSFDLRSDTRMIGRAIFLQDLRQLKKLEYEKIEAERLAAVGQTVASLAHGIKNILMGLEGGMYIMDTGIKKGKTERINQGWEILERNINKISTLAKNLLNFSKGRTVKAKLVSPQSLVREVFELYKDAAENEGILLKMAVDTPVPDSPFDPDEIHTCLTNLVSNALDACKMSDKPDCCVQLRCFLENDSIIFEVTDQGCGMDYQVKQKVFTNFFTTKGAGGTGLGLLTTRKIVQEHGGKISFESTPHQGSVFRLIFPRSRLPKVDSQNTNQ